MTFLTIISNPVVATGVISAIAATALKLLTGRWSRREVTRTLAYGGMPSSHSAFSFGAAWAAGLLLGFDSVVFGVAGMWAGLVVFDALGIRRTSGMHAQAINQLMDDLAHRQPKERILRDLGRLQEVLGHTPLEVAMGMITGIATSYLVVPTWPWWGAGAG